MIKFLAGMLHSMGSRVSPGSNFRQVAKLQPFSLCRMGLVVAPTSGLHHNEVDEGKVPA